MTGINALADALRVSASLTSLLLRGSNLGVEGAKALATGLAASASLTSMDISGNALCGVQFGHGTYDATGITALAGALGVCASLTSLDVSGNNEDEEGMRALGEALLASTSSKLINLKCSKLHLKAEATSLNVDNQGLGPGGAVLIAAATTKFMASLTVLDLSRNGLGSEGGGDGGGGRAGPARRGCEVVSGQGRAGLGRLRLRRLWGGL